MFKVTAKPAVEQALAAAFPLPINSAQRALTKYLNTLSKLLTQASLFGQTPQQRKLGTFSVSLQRLANEGGQIGPERIRVHAWLRSNGLELVRTVTPGSNLTGRVSDVKLTELAEVTEDLEAKEQPSFEFSHSTHEWNPVPESCDLNDYHAQKVDMKSLSSYIIWLSEQANLISDERKIRSLRQAQMFFTVASKSGGWYYQRKRPSVFGRMYYEGLSIQNVNKELRRAILGDCWEYDIRSSVIAWKMGFAKWALEAAGDDRDVCEAFQAITDYLEDKADFMRTMRHFVFLEGTNAPKDLQTKLLKQALTAISFGARATSTGWYDMAGAWTNPALVEIIKNKDERNRFLGDSTIRKFIQEQNFLDEYIFQSFKREAGDFLKSSFLLTPSGHVSKSKVLAFYYQQSETQVMDVLREIAASHGHTPLANVHDAVFFRSRLGTDLKSEIEFEMQERTANPYWRLEATQLHAYTSISKDVLSYEAEHRARIADEERAAVGYKSPRNLPA
jgi:hypothetical protein